MPLSAAEKIKNTFLKESIPFSTKREVNWRTVKIVLVSLVVGAIIVVLCLPTSNPESAIYHEKGQVVVAQNQLSEGAVSDSTVSLLEQSRMNMSSVPRNLDSLYGSAGGSSVRGSGDKNSSMIITRGGLDSKTQLPPGARLKIRMVETVIVAGESVPVIGEVSQDQVYEDGVAIPQGAKLFGDVSFDGGSERAQFSWRSIQMPDGRERGVLATSMDRDGQVGVRGKLHTERLKNAFGQTMTRFVGAYAEGSMQRGAFGGSPGGDDNGWKNAIAETAKDRADSWAEDLKKEKKWLELKAGTEFFAVLREPFTFRDPGGTFR